MQNYLIGLTLFVALYVGLTPKLQAGWKDNNNAAGFIVRNLETPPVGDVLEMSDSQKQRLAKDWIFVQQLSKQLETMNEVMFKAALGRNDTKVKSAALLIAHKYKTQYLEELLERIADEDILVSQCARHSLVRLSSHYCGSNKHIDFGPLPNHSPATKDSIVILWKVWFDEEAKKAKESQEEIKIRKTFDK